MKTPKPPDRRKYLITKRERMLAMIERLEKDKVVYRKEITRIDAELEPEQVET